MRTNVQKCELDLVVSHLWGKCLIDTGKKVKQSAIVLDCLFGIRIAQSVVWRQYREGTNVINGRTM